MDQTTKDKSLPHSSTAHIKGLLMKSEKGKLFTINGSFHPTSSSPRLYMKRQESGRVLGNMGSDGAKILVVIENQSERRSDGVLLLIYMYLQNTNDLNICNMTRLSKK